MTKLAVKFSAMLLGAASLSACVGVREHRGFVLDEQLAKSVQVGVDNKASVSKTLGRPTFVGRRQLLNNDRIAASFLRFAVAGERRHDLRHPPLLAY